MSGVEAQNFDFCLDMLVIAACGPEPEATQHLRDARGFRDCVGKFFVSPLSPPAPHFASCLHHEWQGDRGGAGRSRTALEGFAILCITALLPRRNLKRKLRKLGLIPFVLMYRSTNTSSTERKRSPFDTSGRTVEELIRASPKRENEVSLRAPCFPAPKPTTTSLSRNLERERRLELPTSTLARLRSTN